MEKFKFFGGTIFVNLIKLLFIVSNPSPSTCTVKPRKSAQGSYLKRRCRALGH